MAINQPINQPDAPSMQGVRRLRREPKDRTRTRAATNWQIEVFIYTLQMVRVFEHEAVPETGSEMGVRACAVL